jgi:signal transduction histidine kinase
VHGRAAAGGSAAVRRDRTADDREPDAHSHGLRGLADRLAAAGGELRVRREDTVFTLVATVPVAT